MAMDASPVGFMVVVALAVFSAAMAPLIVIASKRLLDQIVIAATDGLATSKLTGTVVLLAALSGLRGLGNIANNQQSVVARDVTHHVEQRFYAAVASADVGHLDDPGWYDRVSRAGDEIDSRPGQLVGSLVQVASSSVGLFGVLGVLLVLHPVLMALSVAAALPTLFTQRYVTKVMYGLRADLVTGIREKSYVADLLVKPFAAKELRAFGLAPHLVERREEIERPLRRRYTHLVGRTHYAMAAASVVWALAYGGAYAFVAFQGRNGALSIGTLAAVIAAFGQVTGFLGALVAALGQLDQHGLLFLRDYFDLLDEPPLLPRPDTPTRIPAQLSGLEFRDVAFTYPSGDRPALDDVSLLIRPGELVALVGDNGAGKTTLVKLLLRFYLPDSGAVVVGGVDTRDVDPEELRSRVGVLFQDFVPYEFTVAENVSLGRASREVDRDRLELAIDRAQARPVVTGLPSGIDNRVGRMFPGGHDLSGGQWQRLALARLLYRDADIWVLDEPTSALDPEARRPSSRSSGSTSDTELAS